MVLLAGDVGGTKTALALVEAGVLTLQRTYVSAGFSSLEELVLGYLGPRKRDVSRACLGIAGPVIDDTCLTTNLPWRVEARSLERSLGVPRVRLVNDFRALVAGVPLLAAADLAVLNDGVSDPRGPWVLLGAGTGLGEALVIRSINGGYDVVSSEGGHADFAPRDELEMELLRFLLRRHTRVSYERILSGRGLGALYDFLRERSPKLESPAVREALQAAGNNRAPLISAHALTKDDPLCIRALTLFVSVYGAEAGNLALKAVARGGVFVAGGIAPRILPLLLDGTFRAAFVAKGRLSPLVEAMPVRVILNLQAGLLGAAVLAAEPVL